MVRGRKVTNTNELLARKVKCPVCAVGVGEPCRTSRGMRRGHHVERYNAAVRLADLATKPRGRKYDTAKEAKVRKVVCPKCKAGNGDQCTTYSGRKMGFSHTERYEKFDELVSEARVENGLEVKAEATPEVKAESDTPAVDWSWDSLQDAEAQVNAATKQWTSDKSYVIDNLPGIQEEIKRNTIQHLDNMIEDSNKIVKAALGGSTEEVLARKEQIKMITDAFWMLYNLEGTEWFINRIAEMIVDGEDWLG